MQPHPSTENATEKTLSTLGTLLSSRQVKTITVKIKTELFCTNVNTSLF